MATALLTATPCDPNAAYLWTNINQPACATTVVINNAANCQAYAGQMQCEGNYVFRVCATATGCAQKCDNINIKLYLFPFGNTVNAGPDRVVIGDTVIMNAYSLAPLNGNWTKISGPAGTVTISPNNSPSATVKVKNLGTYVFRWTAVYTVGSPCPPLFDEVTIKFI